MKEMREKLRRFMAMLGAATVVGTIAAAIVHGDFSAMMNVTFCGFGAALAFLVIGAVLQPWRRTNAIAVFFGRCVIVSVLAIPASWFASRAVVAFDLWRVKRYVATELGPRFEELRTSHGRYPESKSVSFWENPPKDAPWLLRRTSYASYGQAYSLWVMDPGVCGRVASYSSKTRQWVETNDPCYY